MVRLCVHIIFLLVALSYVQADVWVWRVAGKTWNPKNENDVKYWSEFFYSQKEAEDWVEKTRKDEAKAGRSCDDFNEPFQDTAQTKIPPNVAKREADDKGSCMADVRGEPHYYTFDGAKINFQGTCSYILSQYNASPDRPALPAFKIIGTNDHFRPRFKTTVLVEVRIIYNSHNVVFKRGGSVEIDGTEISEDYLGYGFGVYPGDSAEVLKSDTGLRVEFDRKKFALYISMPFDYTELVEGMLGNFNGDTDDDMRDADGIPRPDGPHGHCLIGDSYQVEPEGVCSYECP